MSVFSHREFDQHEQVSFFHDEMTGLKAIIAIHNTHLGPALGGCRMWAYENDARALEDVLRLSRGMTYKAAVAGLPLGGGKSVIIGDARKHKTPDLMRAMGRAVESFGGDYIVAEDVGMTVQDMDQINKETRHVVGLGGGGGGDPSPLTALGVFTGLKAAVRHRLDAGSVRGLRVAVQGLGHVGYNLCKHLAAEGAELFVTDVRPEIVAEVTTALGATAVTPDAIYDVEADVFAPCALGAILNDATIPRLKARVVAGAANNQLAEARHGEVLRAAEILYAPDYVINAGGLIQVYYERVARSEGKSLDTEAVRTHIAEIGETLGAIFKRAEQEGTSTAQSADSIAVQRFQPGKQSRAA